MERFQEIAVAATAAASGRGVMRVLRAITSLAEAEAYQEASIVAWQILRSGGSDKQAYGAAQKAARKALQREVKKALLEVPAGLLGA